MIIDKFFLYNTHPSLEARCLRGKDIWSVLYSMYSRKTFFSSEITHLFWCDLKYSSFNDIYTFFSRKYLALRLQEDLLPYMCLSIYLCHYNSHLTIMTNCTPSWQDINKSIHFPSIFMFRTLYIINLLSITLSVSFLTIYIYICSSVKATVA